MPTELVDPAVSLQLLSPIDPSVTVPSLLLIFHSLGFSQSAALIYIPLVKPLGPPVSYTETDVCLNNTRPFHGEEPFPLSAEEWGLFIEQQQPIKATIAINKTPAASKTPTLVP